MGTIKIEMLRGSSGSGAVAAAARTGFAALGLMLAAAGPALAQGSAAITSTTPSALSWSNLHGATLTIELTGVTFGSTESVEFFELVLVPAGPGLDVSAVTGFTTGSTTVTLTLSYTGDNRPSDGTLAVRVVQDAHTGGMNLPTGTVPVAGVALPPAPPPAPLAPPAAEADPGAVNESILPELARAMWGSALDAVAGRLGTSTGSRKRGGSGGAGEGLSAAVTGALRANERALADGDASWKDLLGGESFAFALGAGDGGGASDGHGAVVWGAGDWRRLAREVSALDWSGDLFAAHLGVDLAAREDLRAGLAGSWFSSDVDYRGDGAGKGSHESRTTMLSPWLGWDPGAGTRLWGVLGIGWGEIEITEEGGASESSDSRFLAAGAGGAKRVWSDGALTLDAKGSLEATRYEVNDGDAIRGMTVATRRMRVSAEGARVYALEGGATLTPTLEVGARWDAGDGATGGGVEAGGGLAWADPARGVTLEARGRALVAHRRDHLDDWGVSGALRVDPGVAGRGLSFRVLPSWGTAGSGVARQWEDAAAVFPDGGSGRRAPSGARLEAELGYGLPAFSGAGTATPYTGFTSGRDGERALHVGARLGLGDELDLDLRARHDRAPGGAGDNRVELRATARW